MANQNNEITPGGTGGWWLDSHNEILSDPMGNVKIGKVYPVSMDNNGSGNGQVMAAAPAMLHALKKIVKSIQAQDMEDKFGHTMSYLTDAIKKAEPQMN